MFQIANGRQCRNADHTLLLGIQRLVCCYVILCVHCMFSVFNQKLFICLAGMPPTTVLAGTFLETTAPAATTAFSPTVTPGSIVAPAPIHAFFLMRIRPGTSECLSL